MAHLFEHLAFKGSIGSDGEFDRRVEAIGVEQMPRRG